MGREEGGKLIHKIELTSFPTSSKDSSSTRKPHLAIHPPVGPFLATPLCASFTLSSEKDFRRDFCRHGQHSLSVPIHKYPKKDDGSACDLGHVPILRLTTGDKQMGRYGKLHLQFFYLKSL